MAIAKAALSAGAEVTVASRSSKEMTIENMQAISFDASEPSDMATALEQSLPFDHIVVAISANTSASGINATSLEAAKATFSRYWACYNALHTGSKYLSRTGSIVLISGSSARRPVRGYGVWTALHGAIESLAKAAAIDLAPQRINVVSPGGIEMQPDRQLAEHAGKAEDVGEMVVALMSNSAMTNAIVDVDGGERLGTWPSETAIR